MASSGNSSNSNEEEEARELAAQFGKTLKEGERIVGPTRRPDGTLRKPIRIRAGYTPQDEVAIYQSKGTLWRKEMESQVGPPGYDPAAEAVAKPKSKSVKRNERKKEKRQQAALEKTMTSEQADGSNDETECAQNSGPNSEPMESVASQMNELSLSKSDAVGKSSSNPIEGSDKANIGVDIDKKIRALKKKIRLAEAQLQKATPEDRKKPEQQERVMKLEGYREELKLLEGEKPAESSAS